MIVDAPPLTRYADAIALGQLSDGIVLVLEADSTRREAALVAVENLRSSGDPNSRRGSQQAHVPDSGEDLQQTLSHSRSRQRHATGPRLNRARWGVLVTGLSPSNGNVEC